MIIKEPCLETIFCFYYWLRYSNFQIPEIWIPQCVSDNFGIQDSDRKHWSRCLVLILYTIARFMTINLLIFVNITRLLILVM